MARLDRWKDERRLRPNIFVKGGERGDEVRALAHERWKAAGEEQRSTSDSILSAAHEVIFAVRDGEPILHLVTWTLDPETVEFVLAASWELSSFDDDNELKFQLAQAIIKDIPVYPNEPRDEPALIDLYRSLIEDGVEARETKARFSLKRYGRLGEPKDVLQKLSETESLSPGEMQLLYRGLEQQAAEHVEAAKVLAGLRAAIAELNELLSEATAPETELQACLTRNPLLFGPQYREVRPKHRLGSEYEMDYALVRLGGFVDLVEIEKAGDPLYTKAGNPTRQLVHAEQQVLDWLAWIDQYRDYARRRLPGFERPIGFVVIGRDVSLDERTREKFDRRNSAFSRSLEILTFDALVQRAEAILAALTGASHDSSASSAASS